MIYKTRSTVYFSAGHTVDDYQCGDKPHGHSYEVTVTWAREGYPSTDLDEWSRCAKELDDLRAELHHRDLNKMLGAAYPNVFGVATFFMERLAIVTPVTQVEVHESDGPAAVLEADPI